MPTRGVEGGLPAGAPPAPAGDLLRLLAWFSPALPVGAYSYSHGLEYAIEDGLVRDAGTLRAFIEAVLAEGSGRQDALFLAAAYQARGSLDQVIELAAAMRGTRELALESGAQGRALLMVLAMAWPAPELDGLGRLCARLGVEPPYACVAGVTAAAFRVPLRDTLVAFLHAFAANLISAGIRLIPLGQSDGQRLTAALAPLIEEVACEALSGSLDDLGSTTLVVDLCSMRHETQHTRLFRS